MSPDNQQILDDVQAIRNDIAAPHRRRYTLQAKSDHIRLKHDDDVSLTFTAPIKKIRERGYVFEGANFSSKALLFVPEGEQ